MADNLHNGMDALEAMLRVHTFSSHGDGRLRRDRPYVGQPHTFHGQRGAALVSVRLRDIGDALHEALTEMSELVPDHNEWDLCACVQNALLNVERSHGAR